MEIGGYRTEQLIGQGAAGSVWRATAPDGAVVALKVFDGPYEAVLQAAKREASLAVQVDHPHLVRVSALICDRDRVAVAMPIARGGSLADLLARRGRLRPAEVLTVLIPIASALATAHERGVVHGDLSPANIVFDQVGRPLLTDLGAARVAIDCGIDVAATPGYVAPEVARGATPGAAADVFGLGAVALHCLSGRPAWNADDLRDVVVQATVGQWPDPEDGDGPPALLAAVRSALVDLPEKRPGAASLVVDLSRSGTPEPLDLTGAAAAGTVPALSSASAPTPAPQIRVGDGSVAQQRIRLPRTRLRPDAPTPPADPQGRVRSRRSLGEGRRRPPLRVVAAAAGLAVIGVLAVQVGLIWAGAAHPQGSSIPPASTATQASATVSSAAVSSSAVSSAAALSDTVPRSAAQTSSSAAPAPAPKSVRSPVRPASPTKAASPDANRAATPAWSQVADRLDRARAEALTRRDPALLNRVYTFDAPARKADAATISQLKKRGVRVSGAAHRILSVRLLTGGTPIRLEVTDLLPSYQVLDNQGDPIGTTTARQQGHRLLELVRTPDGYRIAGVSES